FPAEEGNTLGGIPPPHTCRGQWETIGMVGDTKMNDLGTFMKSHRGGLIPRDVRLSDDPGPQRVTGSAPGRGRPTRLHQHRPPHPQRAGRMKDTAPALNDPARPAEDGRGSTPLPVRSCRGALDAGAEEDRAEGAATAATPARRQGMDSARAAPPVAADTSGRNTGDEQDPS